MKENVEIIDHGLPTIIMSILYKTILELFLHKTFRNVKKDICIANSTNCQNIVGNMVHQGIVGRSVEQTN